MDAKYIDVITDLMEIEGDIIGLEAANKGIKVNDDGLIVNGIPLPKLDIDAFNMFDALKLGEEAAISKSLLGRFFGRLNVLFSVSPDSRMRKRAEDLMLINPANVLPGPSKLKFNEQSINLFLNAWNYQLMRKEDYGQCEALRTEVERIVGSTNMNMGKMFQSYLAMFGAFIILPLSPAAAIGYLVVTEILFYYYVIMTLISSVEETQLLSGAREEFIRLVSTVVASCYMNGSGKTVKLDKDGKLSIADMQMMKADLDDAKNRMNESFAMNSSGVYVEYQEKMKMVQAIQQSRIAIQGKYVGSTSRKHAQAYNVMSRNWKAIHQKHITYSEHAVYCANLGDVMGSLFELSVACDNHLTTIVRGLYKA